MTVIAQRTLPLRSQPLPPEGRVAVWLANVDHVPIDPAPGQNGRRDQVLCRRVRQQFILRLLLGSYLDCPGKDVRLERGPHGKPVLCAGQSDAELGFNLSHSGDWLAIAVGRHPHIGIDIEINRSVRRAGDLARRYLPELEAEWLSGLDEGNRSEAFLRQWTAREALVKARGASLAQAIGGMELGWEPTAIKALPDAWPDPDEWTLQFARLPEAVLLHVAVPHPHQELDFYQLNMV